MKTLQQIIVEAAAPKNPVIDFCVEYAPHVGKGPYPIERNRFFDMMNDWFKNTSFRKVFGLEKILKNNVKKDGKTIPMIFLMRYIDDPRYHRGYMWVAGINLPSIDRSIKIRMEGGFLWNEKQLAYGNSMGSRDVSDSVANVTSGGTAGPWYPNLKEVIAYQIPESMEKEIISVLKLK